MKGKGRPPRIRNEKNAGLLCRRVQEGRSLREIAREFQCDASAIVHWLNDDVELFQRYARAKDTQAEVMAAELLEIADDGTNDWIQRQKNDGSIEVVPDHEHINRSRLRVDTRKWLMAKMAPKRYGDLLRHTGADGLGPVLVSTGVPRDENG